MLCVGVLTLVSVVCLLWSSLCLVSCLCFKARVDFPWEGVGRVCVFVRVSVCVCDAWLVSVVPLLWSLLLMGSFHLCIS